MLQSRLILFDDYISLGFFYPHRNNGNEPHPTNIEPCNLLPHDPCITLAMSSDLKEVYIRDSLTGMDRYFRYAKFAPTRYSEIIQQLEAFSSSLQACRQKQKSNSLHQDERVICRVVDACTHTHRAIVMSQSIEGSKIKSESYVTLPISWLSKELKLSLRDFLIRDLSHAESSADDYLSAHHKYVEEPPAYNISKDALQEIISSAALYMPQHLSNLPSYDPSRRVIAEVFNGTTFIVCDKEIQIWLTSCSSGRRHCLCEAIVSLSGGLFKVIRGRGPCGTDPTTDYPREWCLPVSALGCEDGIEGYLSSRCGLNDGFISRHLSHALLLRGASESSMRRVYRDDSPHWLYACNQLTLKPSSSHGHGEEVEMTYFYAYLPGRTSKVTRLRGRYKAQNIVIDADVQSGQVLVSSKDGYSSAVSLRECIEAVQLQRAEDCASLSLFVKLKLQPQTLVTFFEFLRWIQAKAASNHSQ